MNLKVDDYIQHSEPFAQPILEHLRNLIPVSYTHLDVYKRQLLGMYASG